MTNITPLSNINYDAILHELTKPRSFDIDDFSKSVGYDLTDYKSLAKCLSEMNTVWIGTGRQRGKTDWLITLMKRHPSSACVTINHAFRDNVAKKLGRGGEFNDRLFTVQEVETSSTKLEDQPLQTFDLVIVDDAAYALQRIKRTNLFEWIAYHGSKNTRIIMLTT